MRKLEDNEESTAKLTTKKTITESSSIVAFSRDMDTHMLFCTEKLCRKNNSKYLDDIVNQNVQRTMKVREQDKKFNLQSYLGL